MDADEKAEEDLTCNVRCIDFLLGILRPGLADMLNSSLKDFAIDGPKLKTKTARHAAWYGKYKAGIPGLRMVLTDLDKATAMAIVSLLGQNWTTDLTAMQGEFFLNFYHPSI